MTRARIMVLGIGFCALLNACTERRSAPTAAAEPDNVGIAQAPAAPIEGPDTADRSDTPGRNTLPDRTVAPSMTEPRRPPARPTPPERPRPVILPSPTQPPAEIDPVLPDPGDRVPL